MPRRPAQHSKAVSLDGPLDAAIDAARYGAARPDAVQAAAELRALAKLRAGLIASPQGEERVEKLLGAIQSAFTAEGLPLAGIGIHNLVVALTNAAESGDAEFFGALAGEFVRPDGPADPVRHWLIELAMHKGGPGRTVQESLRGITGPEGVEYLRNRGVPVDVSTVRTAIRKLAGKRPPGRRKNGR